jgi:integrase
LRIEPGDGVVEGAGFYVIDPYTGAVHEDASARRFFGPTKSGATGRLQPGYPPGRIVDLPPFLVTMIKQYLKTLPEGQDLLFTNTKGQPLRYDDWNMNRWRKAVDGRQHKAPAQRARLPSEPIILGLRLHDGKHSHGAMLDDLSVHPTMRDYRLGHATPGTRGVYSRPTTQMRINLVNALQDRYDQHRSENPGLPATHGPS